MIRHHHQAVIPFSQKLRQEIQDRLKYIAKLKPDQRRLCQQPSEQGWYVQTVGRTEGSSPHPVTHTHTFKVHTQVTGMYAFCVCVCICLHAYIFTHMHSI